MNSVISEIREFIEFINSTPFGRIRSVACFAGGHQEAIMDLDAGLNPFELSGTEYFNRSNIVKEYGEIAAMGTRNVRAALMRRRFIL